MKFTVEHIGLATRDTVALNDWYQRVLGAKLIFATDQTPPAFFLQLPGGTRIEIYKGDVELPETKTNSTAGWRHLALRVDSIEAARKELTARGVEFIEPIKPAGGGGQILFFRDADGNLLHLVERPASSPLK